MFILEAMVAVIIFAAKTILTGMFLIIGIEGGKAFMTHMRNLRTAQDPFYSTKAGPTSGLITA